MTATKRSFSVALGASLFFACAGGAAPASSGDATDRAVPSNAEAGWEQVFRFGFEPGEPQESWRGPGKGSPAALQTPRGRARSAMSVSSERAHGGSHGLECSAGPEAGGRGGKAHISKMGLDFRLGERVRMSAWFFLPEGTSYGSVFLMDLECHTEECFREARERRLALGTGLQLGLTRDHRLFVNSVKFGRAAGERVRGTATSSVPTGRWFELTWELLLADGSEGRSRVFVDGELVLDARGSTLRPEGMPYLTSYDRFEVGVTVNRGNEPVRIFVDDVRLERAR